ncbi:hypothetical protein Droror1_Dr00006977 [Drosera rotundifolia]
MSLVSEVVKELACGPLHSILGKLSGRSNFLAVQVPSTTPPLLMPNVCTLRIGRSITPSPPRVPLLLTRHCLPVTKANPPLPPCHKGSDDEIDYQTLELISSYNMYMLILDIILMKL